MTQIILATRNQGKTEELKKILFDLPIKILSLLEFPEIPEVIEDGATLQENALKKAREVFRQTGIPSLADDTGLEVFALDMQPGVISARYAGEHVSYDDNNRKLLYEMRNLAPDQRTAQFRCIAAFVSSRHEKLIEGICEGSIIQEPRGIGGFGYDPLFQPNGFNQTFAELPMETKNQISHRSKAFHLMKNYLLGMLISPE